MEILTYPIGLLIGLLPVFVNLGEGHDAAHLLLDGRPVCELTAQSSACVVDLGPEPAIHLLELVRTDSAGQTAERVTRWINRPGVEAELRTNGRCDEATRFCTFDISWAHPAKLDPVSLELSLDGVPVWDKLTTKVRLPFAQSRPPQIVSAEATFADGRRAAFTQLLHGSYPETTEASLQAVPIQMDVAAPPETIAATLRQAAWDVEAVEQTGIDVIFVLEPHAFEPLPSLPVAVMRNLTPYNAALGDAERLRVLIPADTVTSFDILNDPTTVAGYFRPTARPATSWVRRLILADLQFPKVDRLRTADAVAVAAYALGASPRRRFVVLIAGGGQDDHSAFSAAQAEAYLRQTLVPFQVWRTREDAAPGWSDGLLLKTPNDFAAAILDLRHTIDRQSTVWLKGRLDLRAFHPTLPAGVRLARGPWPGPDWIRVQP